MNPSNRLVHKSDIIGSVNGTNGFFTTVGTKIPWYNAANVSQHDPTSTDVFKINRIPVGLSHRCSWYLFV